MDGSSPRRLTWCALAVFGLPGAGAATGAETANPLKASDPLLSVPAKIDDRLRAAGEPDTRLEVLIMLRDQPHSRVLEWIRGAADLRLRIAEGDYQALAALPFASQDQLRLARERLDVVVLETRRTALQEIEALIRPAQESLMARLTGLGVARLRRFVAMNMITATIPAAALPALEADPEIAYVVPMETFQAKLDVSVPALGAPSFWNRGLTGTGQAVAMMDSGINREHPAFADKEVVARAFLDSASQNDCFADDASSPADFNGHGTHVAGTVAGQGTTERPDLQGVAHGLGTLYSLKAGYQQKSRSVDASCTGTAMFTGGDIAAALEWLIRNTPVKIVNFSAGGLADSDDTAMARMFDFYSEQYEITFAIAAGNEGPDPSTVGSPAIAYNAIAVANIYDRGTVDRSDDTVSPSSSRGPTTAGRFKPDMAAYGSNIVAAAHNSTGFASKTGTSMAAPHVAGAVALLRQAGVIHPLAAKALLINTTDQLGWRPDRGWGYVNLATAAKAPAPILSWVGPASQPDSARYFRGTISRPFSATLVWLRHVATVDGRVAAFHNLDLSLYAGPNNTLLAESRETIQNVEQVSTDARGDAVLKVKSVTSRFGAGIAREPFALAASEDGFTAASGPALTLACAAPRTVAPGSAFTVTCSATNKGDLEAFTVSGSLAVPDGFERPAEQSFGSLAVSASVARSWRLAAPAVAGTYTFQAQLSSTLYGESFSASAALEIAVAGAPAALSIGSHSLAFSFQQGGSRPAPQAVSVSTGATALPFTASASGGAWLSVSPANGTTPAQVTVSTSVEGLAPGTYDGSITVAATGAANSPQVISVRLAISGTAAVKLEKRLMSRSRPNLAGCPEPAPATGFLPTDAQAFLWFRVTGAAAGDRGTVEWYQPNGTPYQTGAWNPIPEAGSWCFYSGIDIAGNRPAAILGTWSAKVFWNGALFFTQSFDITVPVQVETRMTAGSAPSGEGCPVPAPRSEFLSTDARVHVWFFVRQAKAGDEASVEWVRPNGAAYKTSRWQPLESSGNWCFSASIDIAGQPPAVSPGAWNVSVKWNGQLLFTLPFTIKLPVTLEKKLMTRRAGGCAEPDEVSSFSYRESRAMVWFSVADGKQGDRPVSQWYQPDGTLYETMEWDPLESAGNWCLWAWIDIADDAPASQPGAWNVKITWNGAPLFDLPFTITPVTVRNRLMTKAAREDACAAPEPATGFRPADPRAVIWFLVGDARASGRPKVEWYRPDGALYQTDQWDPVASDGEWCFWGWIDIAGNPPAATPGNWSLKVFWNDIPLFGAQFAVGEAASGNAGSEVSSMGLLASLHLEGAVVRRRDSLRSAPPPSESGIGASVTERAGPGTVRGGADRYLRTVR